MTGEVQGNEVNRLIDDINRTDTGTVTTPNLNYLSTPSEVKVPSDRNYSLDHQKPKRSELVAFLILMKNSFFLAWQFLTSLAFVFFITFVIFPATITDTKL